MPRCDVKPHELHALVLQLFPGGKAERGDGFFLPVLAGRCAECIPVHSSVLQDIAGAPRGHPKGAEWLGHVIPKMLGGVQVGC